MLTNLSPEEPATNAPHATRDTYLKWLSDPMMMYCIMRTVMNDELSHKFKDAQPMDMIQIPNESFGTPEDAERHKTSCCSMSVGERGHQSLIIYCT